MEDGGDETNGGLNMSGAGVSPRRPLFPVGLSFLLAHLSFQRAGMLESKDGNVSRDFYSLMKSRPLDDDGVLIAR